MKPTRTCMNAGALLFAGVLGVGSAAAQLNAAISDGELQEPWMQSRAVVQSLVEAVRSESDPARRARIDRDLDALERDLADLQGKVERMAIGIASNIGYAYTAAEASRELALDVGKVEAGFAALYAGFGVAQRADAVAAQAAIAALREILARERPFERDVTQAIGSGSKNAIQALAGRWWAAGEQVGETRKAVIEVRRRPAQGAIPSTARGRDAWSRSAVPDRVTAGRAVGPVHLGDAGEVVAAADVLVLPGAAGVFECSGVD